MPKRRTAPPRVLVLCSGLGLGNVTRCLAILQSLRRQDRRNRELQLTLATMGVAHTLAQQSARDLGLDVVRLRAYPKSTSSAIHNSPIYYLRPKTLRVFFENRRKVSRLIKELRPDVILIDSDFHLAFLRKRGAAVFSVGQAASTLRGALAVWGKINVSRLSAWVELGDLALQLALSDRVYSPSFCLSSKGRHINFVPLIVREEFRQQSKKHPEHRPGQIIALSGGSGIDTQSFESLSEKTNIRYIRPSQDQPAKTVDDCGPIVDQADAVITHGGLSSLSECVARGRFMFVRPIPGHFEQEVNALMVEKLGLGQRFLDGGIELTQIGPSQMSTRASEFFTNGADVVANDIMSELGDSL